MNKRSNTRRKGEFAAVAAIPLIMLAGAFAVSALIAQPSPTPAPTFQCSWKPDSDTRLKVKKALGMTLERSASNESWRRRLVASANSGKQAVKDMLTELHYNLNIPEDASFIFFEAKRGPGVRTQGEPSEYQESQCVHVFYLPDWGAQMTASPEQTYLAHLRCCYNPW
jgi:hypothetical protein